jgi:hypothetical protein
MTGREVGKVESESAFRAGPNDLNFDGSGLSSGLYIYRVQLENGVSKTGKMVLIR